MFAFTLAWYLLSYPVNNSCTRFPTRDLLVSAVTALSLEFWCVYVKKKSKEIKLGVLTRFHLQWVKLPTCEAVRYQTTSAAAARWVHSLPRMLAQPQHCSIGQSCGTGSPSERTHLCSGQLKSNSGGILTGHEELQHFQIQSADNLHNNKNKNSYRLCSFAKKLHLVRAIYLLHQLHLAEL